MNETENNTQLQKPKTIKLVILAAVIIVLGCFFLLDVLLLPPCDHRGIACRANLIGLGKAIKIYANDFDNKYPTPDKWCDLLIQHTDVTEKEFICPSAGKGRSHYAINPNCKPKSPEDMVLLFETKGGWNQVGGPEILTTENHKGKGCNILFNDSRVEFVKTERLGELKWEVEEGEK